MSLARTQLATDSLELKSMNMFCSKVLSKEMQNNLTTPVDVPVDYVAGECSAMDLLDLDMEAPARWLHTSGTAPPRPTARSSPG